MGFKEDYARFGKPSPEREAFVLKTLTSLPKEQILRSMRPVTVPGPNGTKVTYKVMPDYITVDGMRVPMSGVTAQKVADHFGLNLPTPKMVDEIYQNADVKVDAQPLSGSGTNVDGRQYSGNDVVRTGVGYAPFAVNYNEKVNKQLADKGYNGSGIVAGFAKDIVPPIGGTLGLYGLYDSKGKPIQGGNGQTPHDTTLHTEYGTYVRLVSPDVTITYPDGHTEDKPLGSVYQYARYTPSPREDKEIGTPKGIQEIDKMLNQLSTQIAHQETIDRLIRKYGASFQIMENIGKDPAIKDLSSSSIPGHPPEGFVPLKAGESNAAIGAAARNILNSSQLGDQITFKIGDQLYVGRSEPHFHPAPPAGADPAKYPKPWGWHRGVTVFKSKGDAVKPSTVDATESVNTKGRAPLMERIDGFLSQLEKQID